MDDLIIKESQTKSVEIQKKASNFSLAAIDDWLIARQSMTLKQKVIFFRLLATMVNAGLAVLKSLTILEKQESNPVVKHVYEKIIEGIK